MATPTPVAPPRHDPHRPSRVAPSTLGRHELAVAAIGVLSLLLLPLATPFRILFLKPLWLDELHTWLLSRRLPGAQLADQLARGADFNPPLLYVVDSLMLRLFPWLPAQVTLRLTSVIAMWIALVLLYRLLRERVERVPAAVGVTAVLANSILLGQLHEARFYAPWFALTIALAWALGRLLDAPRSRGRWLAVALLTAATCLIHYFGIIGIACLGVALLVRERSFARLLPAILAVATGMLAFVAWLPVYSAQRHVLTVATWIPAATLRSSIIFVLLFVAWVPYALVIGAAAVFAWREPARRAALPSPTSAQIALMGLVALPFILVVLSYLVQPTLMGRYALPAVAGMATIVALAASVLPPAFQRLALAGMVASYVGLLGWKTRVATRFQSWAFEGVAAVNRVADDPRPVISLERASMYTAALSAASRNTHLAYLVMPRDTILAQLRPRRSQNLIDITILEQDGTIAHNRIFGFPALVTVDEMRRLPSFYFLLYEQGSVPVMPGLFSGYRACLADPRLLLFTASPGTVQSQQSLARPRPCT